MYSRIIRCLEKLYMSPVDNRISDFPSGITLLLALISLHLDLTYVIPPTREFEEFLFSVYYNHSKKNHTFNFTITAIQMMNLHMKNDAKNFIALGTFLNYVIRLGWVGVKKRWHL